MLSEKDIEQLESLTDEQLQALMSVTKFQVRAPIFVGDKARSQAVYDKAAFILVNRIVDNG